MAFTAADVKNLREMTGVGMMDCKKALAETDGNIEKAIEYLREKGLAASQKKAGRIAAEGMALSTIIDGVGVVVEVNAETDFVGKNEKFVNFVKGVAAVVAKENPADMDALMAGILNRGRGETLPDQWQAQIMIRVLQKARLIYISDAPDALVRSLHMVPAHSLEEAMTLAEEILGDPHASITVIPDGVSVIVLPK